MSEQKTPQTKDFKFFGRLRYPVLDEPKAFKPGQDPRWEAVALLDPTNARDAATIKEILEGVAVLAKEHYGTVPLTIKKLAVKFIPGTPKLDLNDPKNEPDGIRNFCIVDGDTKPNYGGYKGMLAISANNSRLKPDVVNKFNQKVTKTDKQFPYDGCDARFCVNFWLLMGKSAQETGKLIGANLRGVQFAGDNTAFTRDELDGQFEALEDAPAAEAPKSAFDD